MVNYICLRCNYSTKRKSNFINHLSRKKICSPDVKDIPIRIQNGFINNIQIQKGKLYINVFINKNTIKKIRVNKLFLCIGSRLDTRVTGGSPKSFARKAKKIMIDIDKNELIKNRGLKIDLKIQSEE